MRILLLYTNLFLLLCFANVEAQIPSNISVEAFLNQLTSKVTKEVLSNQQIQLVAPITLALGNAKVNLIAYWDEEIGETPVEVLSVLVSLNDIVNQFAGYTHLDDLKRQISELSFYVKRNKYLPLIENISPPKLLLAGNAVDIKVEGYFIDVQTENFHASIVLNTSVPVLSGAGFTTQRNSIVTIMPLEKKSEQIRFQLPLEYFTAYRKKVGMFYMNLDLEVPQNSEDSISPKKVRYILPFRLLPSSPGNIYLSYQQTSTANKTEIRKTRTFVQHSTDKYISENYYIPQKDKETVLYESAKLVAEWSDGKQGRDWSYYKQNTSKGVCFTVETIYNPVGISGKVNFHIEYEVEKNTTTTAQKYTSVELDWDDYQMFDVGNSTKWKLEFTDYKGTLHTYRQPISTDLLTISKSGKNLIIMTSSVDLIAE